MKTLMLETDFDEHIEKLLSNETEGNVFFITHVQGKRLNKNNRIKQIIDQIKETKHPNSLLIIEGKANSQKRRNMELFRKECESIDFFHNVHTFIVPKQLFHKLVKAYGEDK